MSTVFTLIGESVALEKIPELVAKNRDKSIGIIYLPEFLKTAYLYIYIPEQGKTGTASDVLKACQTAQLQISIYAEENYDSENTKVITQSRARFEKESSGLAYSKLQAANLDPKFVSQLFAVATHVKTSEPSSSQDTLLVRRQTL